MRLAKCSKCRVRKRYHDPLFAPLCTCYTPCLLLVHPPRLSTVDLQIRPMHFWPKPFAPEHSDPRSQWPTDFNIQSKKGESFSYSTGISPSSYDADIPLPLPAVQHAKTKPSVYCLPRSHKWKGIKTHLSNFRTHIDTGTSNIFDQGSVTESHSDIGDGEELQQENGQVDMIVVDRAWGDQESYASPLEHEVHVQKSETEKPSGHGDVERVMNELITTSNKWRPLDTLRWPVWVGARKFFCTTFSDERLEHMYAEVPNQYSTSYFCA